MQTIELQNPNVFIRPNQAKSTKGKNMIIGALRPEPSKPSKEILGKKSPKDLLKKSTLEG